MKNGLRYTMYTYLKCLELHFKCNIKMHNFNNFDRMRRKKDDDRPVTRFIAGPHEHVLT